MSNSNTWGNQPANPLSPTPFEAPTSPFWVMLTEMGDGIYFSPQKYGVEFEVYPIGQYDDGSFCEPQTGNSISNRADFRYELSGRVKWDGCIDWMTNPKCMAHGCGPTTVDSVTAIFATIFHVAKWYFDLLGDEVPPLPEGALLCDAEGRRM